MADAKSRYEIINELSEKKSDIMDVISSTKKAKIDNQTNFEQFKRNQVRQTENLAKQQEQLLEDEGAKVKANVEAYDLAVGELSKKVEAIDEAIGAIKAISSNNEKSN